VASGISHGDHTAEGRSVHNRLLDVQRIAESPYIIGPLAQVPRLFRATITSAIASVVEIDDLCHIR
jgi:hypothetical protein